MLTPATIEIAASWRIAAPLADSNEIAPRFTVHSNIFLSLTSFASAFLERSKNVFGSSFHFPCASMTVIADVSFGLGGSATWESSAFATSGILAEVLASAPGIATIFVDR